MFDSEKIRAAAEAVIKERGSDGSYTEYFAACDSYDAEVTPETVLELLDEIERFRKDAQRYRAICQRVVILDCSTEGLVTITLAEAWDSGALAIAVEKAVDGMTQGGGV